MRMKTISVLMVGMVLVSSALAQEERKTIPDIGQVKSISLETTPASWMGVFHTNGAARIIWRGGGYSYAEAAAPRGCVSFEEIYNLLVPRLVQNGSAKRDMRVVLYGYGFDYEDKLMEEIRSTRSRAAKSFSYTGYLRHTKENKEIARTLMSGIRDKCVPRDRERFEAMLRDYPLVKGDKPVARVYRKDLDHADFHAVRDDAFADEREAARRWLEETRDSIGLPGDVSPEEQEAYLRKRMKETREEKGLAAIPPEEEERTIAEELARWKFFCERLKEPPVKLITGEVTVVEAGQGEGAAQMSPFSRLYLYGVILAALCAGVAFWLILRKKRSPP